jgi:uncharacterized protein YdaU (DUF1376 family)
MMSTTDHWMRFNVGDYLADTMHLSTFQHGIYMRLIMHYFKRRELPEDERALARIAGISVPMWRRESGPAVSLFSHENGVWKHRRIDAERERADSIREVKQNAGKQGASKRWKMAHANGGDSTCHADTMADSRAGVRGRATEPEPDDTSPPFYPPGGGTRTGRHKNGVKGSEPRNGFTASILADMENADAEPEGDARPSGATVVPISRRVVGG